MGNNSDQSLKGPAMADDGKNQGFNEGKPWLMMIHNYTMVKA